MKRLFPNVWVEPFRQKRLKAPPRQKLWQKEQRFCNFVESQDLHIKKRSKPHLLQKVLKTNQLSWVSVIKSSNSFRRLAFSTWKKYHQVGVLDVSSLICHIKVMKAFPKFVFFSQHDYFWSNRINHSYTICGPWALGLFKTPLQKEKNCTQNHLTFGCTLEIAATGYPCCEFLDCQREFSHLFRFWFEMKIWACILSNNRFTVIQLLEISGNVFDSKATPTLLFSMLDLDAKRSLSRLKTLQCS